MVNRPRGNEEGQAITEYVLMIAIVVTFYLTTVGFLNQFGFAQQLASPIQNSFARAYQYGKPDVYGFENGGPKDHPRITSPGNNRLFINPIKQ